MFIRADMISSEIRKNTDLKRNPCCPVEHQSLRRHLHDHAVTSFFYHLCKILMDRIGLRCRIGCRDLFLSDDRLDRSDQSDLMSCLLQNRLDHISGRRLSLCTGNSHNLQLLCRIPKIRC